MGGRTELIGAVKKRFGGEPLEFVLDALDFALIAHQHQKRRSGHPYIEHPIQTALVLAKMNQDPVTLAAALLHDVLEDCEVTEQHLKEKFGEDVRKLVSAVTKLKRIEHHRADIAEVKSGKHKLTTESMHAYNLRKMFIAMAQDIRVVLIKLSDRLHNMRTLMYLSPERQVAIARETMDIYAPIAHRLGIAVIKWKLEDEAFKYLAPIRYKRVSRFVQRRRKEREVYANSAKAHIVEAMQQAGIDCTVSGRAKHLYSVNRKMERYKMQGKRIDEIYDLTALRIVAKGDKLGDCYHALEVLHRMWRPIPNQFDDYIANPKENLYQSLHTAVIGPANRPLEIQIRTERMHKEAEDGIAAHWSYKEGDRHKNKKDTLFEKAIEHLKKSLIEDQEDVIGDQEYLDNVRSDFLAGQIFVFTPNGDVIELPRGATPLDFAYKVHTELGHRCRGAKVNERMVALDHALNSGDIVQIINSKTPQAPKLDWLNPHLGFLKTSSAQSKVRAWFRRQERQDNLSRGRAILEKERKQLDLKISDEDLLDWLGYGSMADLEFDLGCGDLTVHQMIEKVVSKVFTPETPEAPVEKQEKVSVSDIVVMDFKGLYTRISKCCEDAIRYGDPIIGYMTHRRGISIHKTNCTNQRVQLGSDRWVTANWGHTRTAHPFTLHVRAADRVGLVRDITVIMAEENANIETLSVKSVGERNRAEALVRITVYTDGTRHLSRIFNRLKTVSGITKITKYNESVMTEPTEIDHALLNRKARE